MMASWIKTRRDCRSLRSRFNKINGGHEETRTPDLYRVNFEVNNLKPFACLAFPQTTYLKTPRKQPIFGDELVTSFCRSTSPTRISCKNGFGTGHLHATNAGYGLTGYRESKRKLFVRDYLLASFWSGVRAALRAISRNPLAAASFSRALRRVCPAAILPDPVSTSPSARRASN